MAGPIVAGNWKMNTTLAEARDLAARMRRALDQVAGVTKVVCPPFVSLAAVAEVIAGSTIQLGAQNMHFEPKGAYTGEVSASMLASLCRFVLLGHSERRQHFSETDETVNRKVKAALGAGLRPVLCVGERLEEREQGRAAAVVEQQVRAGLAGVGSPDALVLAYEPVWAIGTGRAATPETAQEMMSHLRGVLGSLYGTKGAAGVPLLYGGSVSPDNAPGFLRQLDVDGALVGGASLDAEAFVRIVRAAAEAKT